MFGHTDCSSRSRYHSGGCLSRFQQSIYGVDIGTTVCFLCCAHCGFVATVVFVSVGDLGGVCDTNSSGRVVDAGFGMSVGSLVALRCTRFLRYVWSPARTSYERSSNWRRTWPLAHGALRLTKGCSLTVSFIKRFQRFGFPVKIVFLYFLSLHKSTVNIRSSYASRSEEFCRHR